MHTQEGVFVIRTFADQILIILAFETRVTRQPSGNRLPTGGDRHAQPNTRCLRRLNQKDYLWNANGAMPGKCVQSNWREGYRFLPNSQARPNS